jgi:hypothetical protein
VMCRVVRTGQAIFLVANLGLFAQALLRTPYGVQLLTGIGVTLALWAVTFGAAIVLSGTGRQSLTEPTSQRGSEGGPDSTSESRSPVSTTW